MKFKDNKYKINFGFVAKHSYHDRHYHQCWYSLQDAGMLSVKAVLESKVSFSKLKRPKKFEGNFYFR